jgi:hypothetical protein
MVVATNEWWHEQLQIVLDRLPLYWAEPLLGNPLAKPYDSL